MKRLLKWFAVIVISIAISISISLIVSNKLSSETLAKINENIIKQVPSICEANKTIRVVEEIELISGQLWKPLTALGDNGEEVLLYCAEPGAAISTTHGEISREDVRDIWSNSPYSGCKHTGKESIISDPYYHCTGVHYSESYSGYIANSGKPVDDLYDVGYIASYFANGYSTIVTGDKWAGQIQQAFWLTSVSSHQEWRDIYGGRWLWEDALAYQKFYREIVEQDENGRTGMKPTDNTKYDEVKLDTDNTTKTHILGPFNISYVDGGKYNESLSFGGISDMYLLDADGNRIDITMLIRPEQEESYKKPNYWTNIDYTDDKINGIPNPNKVDYYADERNYPKPDEPFYVEFKYTGDDVSALKLHIDFKYMKSTATVCIRDGRRYYSRCYDHGLNWHSSVTGGHWGHKDYYTEDYHHAQNMLYIAESKREIIEESIEIPLEKYIEKTMKLGGFVFEDTPQGKETEVNGIKDDQDVVVPGAKVTLYEVDKNGNYKLAKLATLKEENPYATDEMINDPNDFTRRINPTLTDSSGYYEFRGLDTEKEYFVMFTYNGQTYMPTEYLTNKTTGESYNAVADMVDQKNSDKYSSAGNISEIWNQTSKAQEVASQRESFDKMFEEIRSYPENYKSKNTLKISEVSSNNGYNTTFSIYDLMGFDLQEDGKYKQVHTALIDSYLTIDSASGMIVEGTLNGNEVTKTINEGLITKKLREFINTNKRYPTDDEMKSQIYQSIVNELSGSVEGGASQVWRMLQFIEDCKINAYTINNPNDEKSYDLFPVYDRFTTFVSSGKKYPNNSYNNGTYDANESTYQDHSLRFNDEKPDRLYKNIYPGQLLVNCGLWKRQETDMALRKDIYKAALKINDKTVVYNYDKRNENNEDKEGTNSADGKDNNTYWDINVRMSDYDKYYNVSYSEDGKAGYTREIYETDYLFDTGSGLGDGHPGDPLSVYITYKITVRNQSMSILTEIMEVVDYYDKDYEFKPNLSWITYKDGENSNTSIDKDQYYKMMEQDQEVINNESSSALSFITNGKDAKAKEETSTYQGTEKELDNYQKLYINGLQGKKLASGESAYIYLTFEVKKSGNKIILDEDSSPKENLAEINGYKTYYKDNTQLPNDVPKSSNDIAGLIDRDSTPGNLEQKDLEGNKYEKNFEDDTDRAPSLRVKIDEDAVRKANGTVWEDERTEKSGDAIIGDGIRQDKETKVSGVTVQLVEKCVNGTEYIWKETTTNENGQYNFESYIPGDYVIRFKYGDSYRTALSTESKGNLGGENIVAYNGQDFKSTTYQDGIEQVDYTDVSHRYQGYKYTDTQNVTAKYNDKENKDKPTNNTFGYDIYASDEATEKGNNYSDAKDIWTAEGRTDIKGREEVMDYSANNVTNHKAEVLASPYEVPTYNGTEYSNEEMKQLYDDLIKYTQMTAETGMIVVEFEYDRQQTDGLKGTENDENNSSGNYIGDNKKNSNYVLSDIDLGLTERPKAQLEIDKSVANVKVTLANGSILFDINKAANNALWQDHKEYSIDEKIKNGKYEEYYGERNKHRYSYRDEIDKIVEKTDKGLIQLTMDEELMHGATIQITYTVKITNVGEVDYVDDPTKDFYYKGNSSGLQESTTTANQVVDYVQNNLKFDENNEANNGSNKKDGWKLITVKDLTNHSEINDDLVNKKLESGGNNNKLSKFNTIIQTESFGTSNLKPGDEVSKTLILSQLITPENTDDDMTYTNMVEIAKTSNSLGRRMAYSVVGNQDPSLPDASEVDSNVAERIVILPPFGEARIYYILAGVVAIILIGGIILIRRKVLNGKDDKTE